jgi:hypothetical protein
MCVRRLRAEKPDAFPVAVLRRLTFRWRPFGITRPRIDRKAAIGNTRRRPQHVPPFARVGEVNEVSFNFSLIIEADLIEWFVPGNQDAILL